MSDERSSFAKRMQGIAAGVHEFVSLDNLAQRVAGVYEVPLPRARGEVLVFLRDRPAIPLYASRPAGWTALQDHERLTPTRLGRVINPGLHGWGPSGPPAPAPEFRGRTGFFGIMAAGRLTELLLSAVGVRLSDVGQSLGLTDDVEPNSPPAPAVVQSDPTLAPAADSVAIDQQRSGPDLRHIAAVYLDEVRTKPHGAISRAAAKLKRLDGEPMGRTTLVNRLKEATEAGIHTGYPPDR